MEMRQLGEDGPEISVIGYGAWEAGGDAWGPNQSDRQVIDAIHAGLDAGMNWIDTAEGYGKGRSEELVGRAVAGRRDRVHVFTKVAPKGAGSGFRPEQVRGAIRASLQRLGTDHVDLYQLHWPDEAVPVEETWEAMAEVAREGLARHVGVSNFDRSLVERCLPIHPVLSVQNRFSLLHQEDRREFPPWLAGTGVGYLAFSPLALGILTGAVTSETEFHPEDFRGGERGSPPSDFRPAQLQRHLRKVERLRPIADGLGMSVANLALRWVVEQPGVTAAIAGSRNPVNVRSNASVGDLRLGHATLAELDAIFG